MGRVRVSRARREALLNEFERGGTSGAQFADYVGIKYSTFATWIQKRRRRQASGVRFTNQGRRDAHLVSSLPAKFSWIAKVYEKTSGYIHLSEQHIFQALESLDGEERTLCIKVSATDKELSEKVYCEVIEAFCAATEMFLYYVEGWIFTKDNPDLVVQQGTAEHKLMPPP